MCRLSESADSEGTYNYIILDTYSDGSRIYQNRVYQLRPVADPGIPRGGVANSWGGGGRQHTILPNFPKNCMKLKEFGPLRHATADGGVPTYHLPDNLPENCMKMKEFGFRRGGVPSAPFDPSMT